MRVQVVFSRQFAVIARHNSVHHIRLVEVNHRYREGDLYVLTMYLGTSLVRSIAAKIIGFQSYMQPQLLEPWKNLDLSLLSRTVSSYRITKNMELFVHDENNNGSHNHKGSMVQQELAQVTDKPEQKRVLLVMFRWLMSKPKHIIKFANLYIEQGFDVVTVSVTPRQLLQPATGSRTVASELLLFLTESEYYRRIVLHGFSVGGYVWGEALNLMENDKQRYTNVVERIVGQIWDSIADVNEIPIGTPRAIFPKSVWLQHLLQKSMEYHMYLFHNQSTRYYLDASRSFHRSIVRAPALLFISETDPVGSVASNVKLRDHWEALGIQTHMKIFKSSPHVGHFHMHPNDYLKELYTFLDKLDLLRNQDKLKASSVQ